MYIDKQFLLNAEHIRLARPPCNNPVVPLDDEDSIKVLLHFKYLLAFSSADGTNLRKLNNQMGNMMHSQCWKRMGKTNISTYITR